MTRSTHFLLAGVARYARVIKLLAGLPVVISGCAVDLAGTADAAVGAKLDAALGANEPAATALDAADARVDTAPDLLAHQDADADADAGLPARDAGQTDAGEAPCPLSGTYALQAAFDVQWLGTSIVGIVPLVSAGRGEVGWVLLVRFSQAADGVEADVRACQASVPEFEATLPQERYVVHFPDALWDNPGMPSWPARVSTCDRPGCAFSTTTVRALIGTQLPQPDAAWPADPGAGDWPDHDGDGRVGVSTVVLGPRDGTANAYPPINVIASRRTSSFGLGLRVTYAFIGKRDSCDTLSGATSVGLIDSRAVDCLATTAPASCSRDELGFFNDNLPVWTVTGGRVHGDRIADGATCKDVREHFDLDPR